MSINKTKVLVLADWFEPGYKAGGPIRSCINFCEHLKNEFELSVITTDRDLGDTSPYPGIQTNSWITYEEKIKIFYASPDLLSYNKMRELIKEAGPHFIYLNSMYSRFFTLYPLLINKRGSINAKIILAPRGMLKESAIRFKKLKKRVFLALLKATKMGRTITFHCTDETEVKDVNKYFGKVDSVLLHNFPGVQNPFQRIDKQPGLLKLLFVGRIHPIKGLNILLEQLRTVTSEIILTVVGSKEEEIFFQDCLQLAKELPSNIKVDFAGELPHSHIDKAIRDNHVFILPTKGENFGHAIVEALAAGRPVIISDQTPWKNLNVSQTGFDISLDKPEQFSEAIEFFAGMEQGSFDNWCLAAWKFASKLMEVDSLKADYIKLFTARPINS